jgi:hypothetical protein
LRANLNTVIHMLADDLTKAAICERDGIIYAAGLDGGYAYFEWSQDSGATKAPFPGGMTRKPISLDPVESDQPAIVALQTGQILVALAQAGAVRVYRTDDEGEHWELTASVA